MCSVCDGDDENTVSKLSPADFKKLAKGIHDSDAAMEKGADGVGYSGFDDDVKCDKTCCKAERESIAHNHQFLDQVCAKRDKNGALAITALSIIDGG